MTEAIPSERRQPQASEHKPRASENCGENNAQLPPEVVALECGQSYIVCAFYTPNYLPQILALKASLQALGLNHFLKAYAPRGGWEANTRLKPEFIDHCLTKFPGYNIVYVDADAIVRKPMHALENMTTDVTMLFHPTRANGKWYLRISAGTLAVRNSPGGRRFAQLWKDGEATAHVATVDEDMMYGAFRHMAGVSFTVLSLDYHKIFDQPGADPTIEHFQASRNQFKIRKAIRRALQLGAWAAGLMTAAYIAYRWKRGG